MPTPAASITARASRPQPSMDGSIPAGSGSDSPRPPQSKRINRENSASRSVWRSQLGSSAVSSMEIMSPLLNSSTSTASPVPDPQIW